MKYSLEVGKIIEGSIKFDYAKVKNFTKQLIERLKKDGDYLAAEKFERLYDNSGINVVGIAGSQSASVPIDQESKIKLADIFYPSDNNYVTILNESNYKEVDLFINSIAKYDTLNKYGLSGGNTLLLFGPPGCGKTNCAFMIAKKLNLPIVVARLDSLISSYLGTTSKNIRLLFDFVTRTPCVLFLDEFDAIAKARDDKNELGELKRVVNTLLQNIDSLSSENIIIAATNHAGLLDSAVWRRFEYKIELEKPDQESREKLVTLFLEKALPLTKRQYSQIAICFDGETGSSIKELIVKSMKRCVLNDTKISFFELFEDIFQKYVVIDNHKSITNKEKIKYLCSKNQDCKYFTYNEIADLLNVSKAYVSIVMKEEENDE